MAKKIVTEEKPKPDPETEEEESEEEESDDTEESELEEEVDDKAAKAIKKGAQSKKVQNIIGDITPPEDPADEDDVKSYLKRIDAGLNKLLAASEKKKIKKPATKEEPKPAPKVPWHERDIFS